MKNDLFVIAVFVALMTPSAAFAEHTRVTHPGVLSVEALGKGLLFSAQFDSVINDDMAAGIGIGNVGLNDAAGNDTGRKATLVPLYMHYYFAREHGSFFGELGATIVTDSSGANGLTSSAGSVKFGSSAVQPTVGLGFEERRDTGLLFRVAAYGIIGKEYAPWFGFSFGYAF